ncbi:transglutaminase family protein [Streptomyces sp. ISL-44]|uniref:transglutaminase-like domain-containing protein n=1 Tax=unclassified Streptomyces TaxID=2593676 RepID=UPI001BE7B055|nr:MULTISPECIES: transglutaminase family protein [unclassified Streptomyces]MBT2543032.1 transglutaminase family protein [Streptomyces sp. ISL-44]MCX5015833.1 transglutaminase family protein [Streptomyces sp. NBC_00555]UUU43443.1 transglutaminase family protein [Streptomyces sp. NBC_00162]
MELIQEQPDLAAYLAADEAIDHEHPLVRETADAFWTATGGDAYAYAEAVFEFVRDAVPHSADSGDLRVAWRASDVLATRNGICHAKSHALAALLRAQGIPAALCYQRLADDDGGNHLIHGLIALRLPGGEGWARVDPRGNKPGVDARFSLDVERLAFPVRPELGEVDHPELYAAPHPAALKALQDSADRPQLWENLPTAL